MLDSQSIVNLTDLVKPLAGEQIERLSICGDGSYLVAGSREHFVLISLRSKTTVTKGEGRFAALSPDGWQIAFVNRSHELAIWDRRTETARILRDRQTTPTLGVGTWDPSGRFLLVGIQSSFLGRNPLIAYDVTTGQYCRCRLLGEGMAGEHFTWIDETIVSA